MMLAGGCRVELASRPCHSLNRSFAAMFVSTVAEKLKPPLTVSSSLTFNSRISLVMSLSCFWEGSIPCPCHSMSQEYGQVFVAAVMGITPARRASECSENQQFL